MTDQLKGAALPPRPNLGPEPLPERVPSLWAAFAIALIIAVVLAAVLLVRRRKGRSRRRGVVITTSLRRESLGEPLTPRDRMIALATEVRAALSRRFGPSSLAKTTEELADDPRIGRVLSRAHFDDLIGFLNAIDRLKFSDSRLGDSEGFRSEDLAVCERSVTRLTEALLQAEGSVENPEADPEPVEVRSEPPGGGRLGGRRIADRLENHD